MYLNIEGKRNRDSVRQQIDSRLHCIMQYERDIQQRQEKQIREKKKRGFEFHLTASKELL